jgi:hypothetical protein
VGSVPLDRPTIGLQAHSRTLLVYSPHVSYQMSSRKVNTVFER